MAESRLNVVVQTRGERELQRLGASATAAEKALDKLRFTAPKLEGALRGTGKGATAGAAGLNRYAAAASATDKAVRNLSLGLKTLGAALVVKTIFSAGAELERTKIRLETLTGSAENAEKVFRELQEVNRQSPFELKDLTGAASRLSAFGVKLEDLVTTTERLGKIAAATGQDLEGISLAYGQVLAKGRLQGEELLQFQERGIPLAAELQKMLGLTGEEFQKMTSQGKVSAQLVEEAIKRMTGETGRFKDAFKNTSDTLDAKLSNLQDKFFMTAAALGKAFEPVFKWVLDRATEILGIFEQIFNRINRGAAGAQAEFRANETAAAATIQRYGHARYATRALTGDKEVSEFYDRAKQGALEFNLSRLDKALQGNTKAVQKQTSTAEKAPTADVARYRAMLTSGTAGGGGGGSRGTGSSTGPKLPAYIDKEVLRKWLYSQGMGRTSGDFTNAGHRTPNHMLNAMDMGFTAPQYDRNYVQKTKEMEAKLRATGAFGNQLFGPTSDPRGHATHLHIPTPGGKVKMTPGLASLMGMSGAGQEGQYELAQGLMEQQAEQLELQMRSQQEGEKMIQQLDREQKLLLAGNDAARDRLQIDFKHADTQAQINELLDEGQRKALTAANDQLKAMQLKKLEGEEAKKALELRQQTIGPLLEENAALEAKLAGTEEEYQLRKKIAELQKAGITATEAEAVATRNQALQQQVTAMEAAEADASAISGTISGGIKDAIKAAVTGGDVKAALSNMLMGIGDKLLDMAFKPLEDLLTKQLTSLFNPQQVAVQANTAALVNLTAALQAGAFGIGPSGGGLFGGLGSLGGMFGGGGLGSFGTPSAFSPFSLPGGGLLGRLGPLDFIPFSGGGYTGDAPRSGGVDGEGGFPAILHPQETVIDHGGLRRGMNGGKGAGGGASPITLNVTATKIGDSEFVKVNDLQVALRESEKRSAAAGEQRTIARLKNSPQTRRNIGLR